MKFRKATVEDEVQIKALCDSHNMPHHPSLAFCFVAEDEGKIVGYINGGVIGYLESIVSDNPMATVSLFSMLEGVFEYNGVTPIFASIHNEDAGRQLQRLGYEDVSSQKHYLKRK